MSSSSAVPRPPIIDAHLDMAHNAQLGYDLRLPLPELRASPVGRAMTAQGMTPTVSLPALREGGVRLAFGTIFVLPANTGVDLGSISYTTAEEAHRLGSAQIDYYRRLEDDGLVQWVRTRHDVPQYAAPLEDGASQPLGLVLLMENADAIRTPSEVEWWFDRGVRIVGPAWSKTRYCGGTRAPGPLTPDGRALMGELARTGIVLDMAHMAEESFWQALQLYGGPVIASHANCRALVPTDRQLSDDMIRAIIDRDGIIGALLYNNFIDATWTTGTAKDAVRLTNVVRHIEHICELAQDVRHVGIGSDLDGGFGMEGIPAELDSCIDLAEIGQALLDAGWRRDEADLILGGNWFRWLEQSLPAE